MGLFFIYKGGEWYCHKSQSLKTCGKLETRSEMKLGKLFSIAEVLDVTPDKLLSSEAKTTSNKLFEMEHCWKQLNETDQILMMSIMKRMLQHT